MELNKETIKNIKACKIAYIIPLNNRMTRFACYLCSARSLKVLWPEPWDKQAKNKFPSSKESTDYQLNQSYLLGMSYTSINSLPAYHYHFPSSEYGGFSICKEIQDYLKVYNPEIKVYILNGKSANSNF